MLRSFPGLCGTQSRKMPTIPRLFSGKNCDRSGHIQNPKGPKIEKIKILNFSSEIEKLKLLSQAKPPTKPLFSVGNSERKD